MLVTMKSASAALLVGYLNTVHLPDGVDALAGSGPDEWLADGLVDGGRSVAPASEVFAQVRATGSLDDLRRLREALRGLTRREIDDAEGDRDVLHRAADILQAVPVVLHLADGADTQPRLVPASSRAGEADGQLAAIADAYLRSTIDETFSRVKTCALPECQWAFYDTSRNRSRRWCAMDGCGNRVKNRSYRARRALHP